MEAALARTATPRLSWRLRLDVGALWIWALCAGLVLYLGLEGGGYDLVLRSDAAVVVWWIVLVGAVCGVLPSARLSRSAWVAVALFGAFLVWTAIASSWSLSSENSLQEVSRLSGYLGVLVLAVITYGDRRCALSHAVMAVASAIVVLVALALVSRLRPGSFAGAATTGSLLPGTQGRLSWPLNYWNALAAMVALGLPLLLSIATSARRLAVQAAAAAAIPMAALCGYLTFSRGGAIASAVAVIVFIALSPERIPKLATLTVAAAGSAALIAGAVHRHAVEQGATGALARHQGSTLAVAVILVCAGVALAQVGIGLAARHGTLPRLLRVSPKRARMLLAAAVVVAIALAVAAHAPSRLDHAWQQFKRPAVSGLHQDAIGRYGALSGNGRYTYWKTALDALPGHALGGWGPGTFQMVWLPRAPYLSYVVNAHSLYVETLSDVGIIGLVLLAAFLGDARRHRALPGRAQWARVACPGGRCDGGDACVPHLGRVRLGVAGTRAADRLAAARGGDTRAGACTPRSGAPARAGCVRSTAQREAAASQPRGDWGRGAGLPARDRGPAGGDESDAHESGSGRGARRYERPHGCSERAADRARFGHGRTSGRARARAAAPVRGGCAGGSRRHPRRAGELAGLARTLPARSRGRAPEPGRERVRAGARSESPIPALPRMIYPREPDRDLEPADHELSTRLTGERPLPTAEFRGVLARHLAARDPGHGSRPERLRRTVALWLAAGAALGGLGLLQALGIL